MADTVEIVGLAEMRAKIANAALLKDPVTKALEKSALLVEGGAKRLAPVDTGRLRASITHRLDSSPIPQYAEVGTNVTYAQTMEYGRRAGARMPPPAALATWARRHGGMDPFVLARSIAKKGIKPRPFLNPAFEGAKDKIAGLLSTAAKEVEAIWRRR